MTTPASRPNDAHPRTTRTTGDITKRVSLKKRSTAAITMLRHSCRSRWTSASRRAGRSRSRRSTPGRCHAKTLARWRFGPSRRSAGFGPSVARRARGVESAPELAGPALTRSALEARGGLGNGRS